MKTKMILAAAFLAFAGCGGGGDTPPSQYWFGAQVIRYLTQPTRIVKEFPETFSTEAECLASPNARAALVFPATSYMCIFKINS